MPNEKPPFDVRFFLKGQRALAEALLDEISQAESRMLSEALVSAKGSTSTGASFNRFFIGILVGLAVLAGFLVIKPPRAPSPEVAQLKKDIVAQKAAFEARIADLTAMVLANQVALTSTQDALRVTEKELVRTQNGLRAIREAPSPTPK